MVDILDKTKQNSNFQIKPKTILFIFFTWTILGLPFALKYWNGGFSANAQSGYGDNLKFWKYLAQILIIFNVCASATPIVFWLQRKFSFGNKQKIRNIVFHVFFSIIFTITTISLSEFIVTSLDSFFFNGTTSFIVSLKETLTDPITIYHYLLIYLGIVLISQGIEFYKQMRNEQFQVVELATQLSEAKLNALKMQIHPHFLFNTLNSIASLIHEDVEAADLMLNRLSDFLRMTLNSSCEQIVTLKTELSFINTYLEIEKVRFSERLKVEILADESILSAKLPNFILQPILENSIKHGLANKKTNCLLKISAQKVADRLIIEVTDNGKGLDYEIILPTDSGSGLGLSNTLARLKQIYNDDFAFEIKGQKNKGTMVRFDLPFTD